MNDLLIPTMLIRFDQQTTNFVGAMAVESQDPKVPKISHPRQSERWFIHVKSLRASLFVVLTSSLDVTW